MQQKDFLCKKHSDNPLQLICIETNCQLDRVMCNKCQFLDHQNHKFEFKEQFYENLASLLILQKEASFKHTQQKDGLNTLINNLDILLKKAKQELNEIKDISLSEYLDTYCEKVDQSIRKIRDLSLNELKSLMENIFEYIKMNGFEFTESLSQNLEIRQDKYLEIIQNQNKTVQELIQQLNNKKQYVDNPKNNQNKEISKLKEIQTIKTDHSQPIASVAFSQDSKMIATGGNGEIKIWSVSPDIKVQQSYKTDGKIIALAFSNDDKILASGGIKHIIQLWDVTDKNNINPKKELKEHDDNINRIAFSSNAQYMVSGGDDGKLILWNCQSHKSIQIFQLEDSIHGLSIHNNSQHVAIITGGGQIQIYDINSKKQVCETKPHSKGGSVQFSKDGKYLASSGKDAFIILWDAQKLIEGTDQQLKKLTWDRQKESFVWCIVFASNSQNLFVLDQVSKQILLWSVEKDTPQKKIDIPDLSNGQSQYQMLDISPNMQHIVVGDQKNNLICIPLE